MPLGSRIYPSEKDKENSKEPGTEHKPAEKEDSLSQNTLFHSEEPKYCFDDIVLADSVYSAIQDTIAIYEKRDLVFNQWGLGVTHKQQNRAGINLYGAPGTGKSMVAHAIAKQLDRKILTVDYSQIESKYVGVTSKNLVAMFDYAKSTGAVLFFDEADALLSKRVTNMSSSTDVSVNQTRSVLLLLINEFDDLLLFATNFITNLDPAFMRRILGHVKFDLPDEATRMKLWRMYIPPSLPTNADVTLLAEKFSGISGSDISNAVLAASLRAARLNEEFVEQVYLEEAIERIRVSKTDNAGTETVVSSRVVSEDYVKEQLGGLPIC